MRSTSSSLWIVVTWLCFAVNLIRNDFLANSNSFGVSATKCFTCDGKCMSDVYCNCQTGMCEADYCFVEKTIKDNEHFLRKGCARGKISRKGEMCEMSRNKKSDLCVCNSDFCNFDMSQSFGFDSPKNVTCNKCKSARGSSGCTQHCQGDYCWVNGAGANSGPYSQDCSYGNVNLQFHGPGRILHDGSRHIFDDGTACYHYSAGTSVEFEECICNNNKCNYPTLPQQMLTVVRPVSKRQRYVTCYSCVEISQQQAISSSVCKAKTCQGQFCVLTVESQTADRNDLVFRREAGCLNSSRPLYVEKGCNQRWTLKKWEKIECVCQSDFCNVDVATAVSSTSMPIRFSVLLAGYYVILRFS